MARLASGPGRDGVEVGLDHLGGQLAAVAEGHPVAQVEGETAGVVADLPALGQPGHDLAGLRVLVGEGVDQLAHRVDRVVAGHLLGVGAAGVGADGEGQCPAGDRLAPGRLGGGVGAGTQPARASRETVRPAVTTRRSRACFRVLPTKGVLLVHELRVVSVGRAASAALPLLGQQLVGTHPVGVVVGDGGDQQLVRPGGVAQPLQLVGDLAGVPRTGCRAVLHQARSASLQTCWAASSGWELDGALGRADAAHPAP